MGKISLIFALAFGAIFLVNPSVDLAKRSDTSTTNTTTSQAVGPRCVISGLSTVNQINTDRSGKPFDTSNAKLNAFVNPNMAGVTFRTSWADVEKSEGTFDYSKLDNVFASVKNTGKWVYLILIPGFGTPGWARQGVQTAQMPLPYGPGGDQSGSSKPYPLPVPWDSTYLSRWFAFLQAIATRYGSNPSFRMIAADGPTSVSGEMSLPNRPDDLTQWKKLGYTSDKYIAAWKQTFAAYAATFPKQCFSLALYPGLPIPGHAQKTEVREAVIRLGMQYPRQFALEENGLKAAKAGTGFGYTTVIDNIGRVATGFEMSTSAVEHADKMGVPGNPQGALRQSIDLGMKTNSKGEHIDYLQIYEPDVISQQMQSTLQYGASFFAKEPKPGQSPMIKPTGGTTQQQ